MIKKPLIQMIALCAFALTASAQDTNAMKTLIGVFEAQTGVTIVKGFGQVGSVSMGAAVISVRSKETADAGSGHKVYGLGVEIEANPLPKQRILIDDDEIDSLLAGMDYLLKISYDVTSLPSFEASYTTKSGLRVFAYSVRKNGGIQMFLQYGDYPRIALSSTQLSQLYGLIDQASKNLTALKTGK